ncbi:MAG: peptidoglycan DD-metalloendopeptidase family protein [Patescibacteria group bacterium]
MLKRNFSIFLIIFLVFVIVLTNNTKKSKAQELPNKIKQTTLAKTIKSDFEELEEEELIVESATNENLEAISSPLYLDLIGTISNKNKINTESEENDFFVISEHGDVLSKTGVNLNEEGSSRNKILEYSVQTGDTVSSIAEDFGLSVNTILWENNLTARTLIKPGSKLIILPQDGIRHIVAKNENISKIASKYGVTIESIAEGNDIDLDDSLKIGEKIFIPGGKKIIQTTTVTNRTYSGTSITQNTGNTANQQPAYTGGKLLWPTVGARITQYYSWRHQGLDIANKTGTPLYAAEAGTVLSSGWSNGYGYNVVISHGGGLKTLYAHASKLHVKAGDQVGRGDIIADMGSTGWSTGPHIHFEVILNGVKQNPLNYIK